MNRNHHLSLVVAAGLVSCVAGCGGSGDAAPITNESPGITADGNEDHSHDHRHTHGDGNDHGHEHGNFKGTHSHGHTHGHRHADPLHGGEVVSIGHTHHKGGVDHFHAEVLPIADGTIAFHVLTENADGDAVDHEVEAESIQAFVSDAADEDGASREVAFRPDAEDGSRLVAEVPEEFGGVAAIAVVVPRIVLGKQRLHFSFDASRPAAEEESKP